MDEQVTTILTTQIIEVVQSSALLAVGVFLAMRVLTGWHWLAEQRWFRRLLPVLPPALGLLGAFADGGLAVPEETPALTRLIYGLGAAYCAEKIHKVLGQTILGDDRKINRPASKRRDPAS